MATLQVDFPIGMQTQFSEGYSYSSAWATEDKGIQITSDVPVSVVVVNYALFFMESYLVNPTTVLGTKFYALTATPDDKYSCQVTAINPSSNSVSVTVTQTSGSSKTTVINSLQTLTYSHTAEASGTKFEADNPIAVIADCTCAATINGNCNPEVVMLTPVSGYQTEYPIVSFTSSSFGDVIRVVTDYGNTEVKLDGRHLKTINAGEFFNFTITKAFAGVLSATRPVSISQMGQAYAGTNEAGNKFMTGVPSKEQFITGSCMFSTLIPSSFDWGTINEFLNLITVGDVSGSMQLNGAPINQQWAQIGSTGYYYTRVKIPKAGNYTISSSNPSAKFSPIVYGYAFGMGYGYVCGMNLPRVKITTTTSTTTTTTPSTTMTTPATTPTNGSRLLIGLN